MTEPFAVLPRSDDAAWRSLYRVSGVAALAMFVLIPIQSILFVAFPPPATAIDYFALFQQDTLLGLLSLDLLYLIDMALMGLVYLALYAALARVSRSLMTIALAVAGVATAAYFASNTAFSMLALSHQYAEAAGEPQRAALLGAGEAMLAIYQGTANGVTYVLFGVANVISAWVMLKSHVFGKLTAGVYLFGSLLMVVPPAVGTVGVALAMASLLPFAVWLLLVARRFFQLGQGGGVRAPRSPKKHRTRPRALLPQA